MTYTKKQFLEDVAKEATALKKHAKSEEISRLDFDELNPRMYDSCIYGQMTGDCFSARASYLIHNCCNRYFIATKEIDEEEVSLEDFSKQHDVTEYVNGKKVAGVNSADEFYKHRHRYAFHYSSIEAYIMQPNAKNANLIAFLKGERKDLVL